MRRCFQLVTFAALIFPGQALAQGATPASMDSLLQRLVGNWQMVGNEARVFLGVDSVGPRYIGHWLDSFGAGYSIPHAVGEAHGDTIQFTFAYADGPFRDTFVYDRLRATWHFRLESGDSTGGWHLFADYQVQHR